MRLNRRDFLKTGPALAAPALLRAAEDVVIENSAMRLVITGDGMARSLVHKASGQECLFPDSGVPAFAMTQYSPLPGQLTLLYPADPKVLPARSVRREGSRLVIAFEAVAHEVTLALKITDHYVAFTVEKIRTEGRGWRGPDQRKTPIEELVVLQLPVRDRANFGRWLNVMWDQDVAVNLLGGDPWGHVDSQERKGYRLMRVSTEHQVRTEGVTAVLLVTRTASLLDHVAEVERDYNLPRGVESRRRPEYRQSYYWVPTITPATADRQIAYARQAGFSMMMISYRAFAKSAGHFPWRNEYPRGMEDLRAVVGKIRAAGLTAGLHLHYCKAGKTDPYVTGRPDHRLNLTRIFTLAEPLSATATTITVEEDPQGATLDDDRRFLKLGEELVTYEGYTATPPYRFTGCRRGALNTRPAARETGFLFGLLDVDTWPIFVRLNQNSSIQREVAERVARLYDAGFEFVYFDGAEDVHMPFWFTTSWAQWLVYQRLKPEPRFSEGAFRSHFSWHMLSRGHAFDTQQPEFIKPALGTYQAPQAARMAKDFTRINFGWVGYVPPTAKSPGTQPDMIEYVTSRAAAWDCPVSAHPRLEHLDAHPRTPDNLEVFRRWEDVRRRDWLTAAQKQAMRDLKQEHTLLVNERGEYELMACEAVPGPGHPLRAFVFERAGQPWAVYWHTSGEGRMDFPLRRAELRLGKETGTAAQPLPVGGRRYLTCPGATRADLVRAFQEAKLIG